MVDACGARWTYPIDASLSRKFGRRTTMVGDLENSSYDLITISNSYFSLHAFAIDDFLHVLVSMLIMLNDHVLYFMW